MLKYVDRERDIKTREYMVISRALAQHEVINGRMKEFGILRNTYRCDRSKHLYAFSAIAAMTQIEIENGRPVFEATDYADKISNNI